VRPFYKPLVVAVLLASNWLTAFQIGDAAEDAVEDVTTAQVALAHGVHFSQPALPDDDDDDNFLNIANQSLLPAPISVSQAPRLVHLSNPPVLGRWSPLLHLSLRNLSPPCGDALFDGILTLRHLRFAASLRILAPPGQVAFGDPYGQPLHPQGVRAPGA
jgi:hypothetical protein